MEDPVLGVLRRLVEVVKAWAADEDGVPEHAEAAFNAAVALLAKEPRDAPTVDVRVAVVVCADGHYNTAGWSGSASERYVRDAAIDGADCPCPPGTPEHLVWVSATVPLPTTLTIKGRVAGPAEPVEGLDG